MVKFRDYVAPETTEEAYEALLSKNSARLVGGGCFMRMGKKRVALAVDLWNTGLNYIEDTGDEIEIGAMTTLHEFETSEILKENFGNIIKDSVKHIIGVQLRNIATIGATVFSKYGFSDPLTALLALDADVVLHKGGRMPLGDFLEEEEIRRDILEKVVIRKDVKRASFQTIRNSAVDYAILSVAFAEVDGEYKISVGARPRKATLAYKAMGYLQGEGLSEESAIEAGELASEELHFGDNNRGSAKYRQELCKVLVKRAILEVME